MIVPVTTPQNNLNQSPSTKTDNNNNRNNSNNNSTHITNLCYEPTSVLDLRRSPSPVAGKPAKVSAVSDVVLSHATNESTLEWVDDQVLHNLDWDTIMRELGLHDDSVPAALKTSTTAAAAMATATTTTVVPQLNNPCVDPHQITSHFLEFPHPQPFDPTHLVHSTDFNFDHSSNSTFGSHHHNLNLFEVILDRLNQRLRSGPSGKPVGRPFQRAALYFKEALQSILSGSNRTADRLSSWAEIVQTIRGYKAFSGISPIPMFSHFTTNQALLEALSGSTFIHVVDFDIGLGGQYASLMKELAEKSESLRVNPPILRITAVVPVEYAVESRLIRENLTQFSQELKIRFQIDFVLVRVFEALSFKAINFREGEKIAVLFSSAVLRRHGGGFLGEVRRVSPAVVVFVDGEGWGGEPGTAPTTSFRRNFVGGLEFYSMVMESLDAAMVGAELVRKIEAFVLRPKIIGMVEAAAAAGVGGGRRTASFREMFHGAGMRPVHLSQFADFQAECLLGKVQVRGFHVAKRQAELALCWHERALVATSVWRC
ncbi:scarecrow-like protein 15 isoform X2 [Humulus lupulus]|uniref:scarecrow-like protein 15 isoform X2 n=1 Tax=Humulus lupulus TaxID=3486 RepID=UPI002B4122CE|nr:scarecrow-like protein 15 isoform X2 [Humulus lupulus]